MNAVELNGLVKSFGRHVAVNKLTLRVPEKSVYGFIGPNGSGKTTTLRMIMNILYPDAGRIRIFDGPTTPTSADRIGYLPEERGLYKRMKVRDLLVFLGRLKTNKPIRPRVDAWLERLGLTDWANKKVETLSKGMSQKVQFIATVVAEPDLVILDEPFSGLDPVNTEVMKDAILEFQAQGATVIFSTHDMAMAEKMCDFIFMIFKGEKVLDGSLEAIQDQYASDTIRVRVADGADALRDLPGVQRINDYGQTQALHIAPDADSQHILKTLLARTRVQSFAVEKPSLHDIFVRIAGQDGSVEEEGQSHA